MTGANPINPMRIFHELSTRLPANAIVASDSGSAANWYARHLKFHGDMRGSLSGTLATMGPGVPYVIGAKWAHPDRPAIALVGDGAMQMNGMAELITIAHYWSQWADPRLIVAILHNNDLNQVTWEMRAMEGAPKFAESQTLPDVDFAAFARSLGLDGVNIDDPDDDRPGLGRGVAADRPTVLDIRCDPDVPPIPPHATFDAGEIRRRRDAARRRGHAGGSSRKASNRRRRNSCPGRKANDRELVDSAQQLSRRWSARALTDVRTGRFERSLSALTAAGAAVTTAEVFLSHDGASFGNKMMWWPVVIMPTAVPAGIAAVFSARAARTVLPAGLRRHRRQRTAGHLPALARHRPTPRRAGPATTWRGGPPMFAPLLASLVGGMGLLAAVLRREGDRPRRDLPQPRPTRRHPAAQGPVPRLRRARPDADVWDDVTAGVVLARLAPPNDLPFFTAAERAIAQPLLDLLLAQDGEPRIPVLALIDTRLAIGETDGWHYDDLPAGRRRVAAHPGLPRPGRRGPLHGSHVRPTRPPASRRS